MEDRNFHVSHQSLRKLRRSFYIRPTLTVARDLLGKYIVRMLNGSLLVGKIVEVEAYLGEKDPASHAYRGKTTRNEVMFREGGRLYVYFTYGMHFCCNVVTEREGTAGAVLLRAVEPMEGIDLMAFHRGYPSIDGVKRALTNGPARLCQAFAIGREQNGADLLGNQVYITRGDSIAPSNIECTRRIGIRRGIERKWRFLVCGNPWVSK